MTEDSGTNNVGYSGYVAHQPEPDLNKCIDQEANQDIFSLFSRSGIRDDQLTIDLDVMQSQGPGLYYLDNQNGCSCGLEEARSVQVSQPGISFTGGYGWIAENGCLVNNDSKLRQEPSKVTNRRDINQITERLFLTTPNLKNGYHDVDVESAIRPGNFTTDKRSCGPLSGVTIGNYFTPMIKKLKSEVQDTKHIIPEDSMQSWVRGGIPSREMVRNKDYLRRYQEKTFSSN